MAYTETIAPTDGAVTEVLEPFPVNQRFEGFLCQHFPGELVLEDIYFRR